MHDALHAIHRLYRNLVPAEPTAPLRITHALGVVWYAGRDRVLVPGHDSVSTPWCQLGVVPEAATDGIEDRLIVCDAQLAEHRLAWRVDADANAGNVYLRVARQLRLIERVDAMLPGSAVLFGGHLVDPLGEPAFVAHTVTIDGIPLTPAETRAVAARLGIDSG